jgi:hypothetical protein
MRGCASASASALEEPEMLSGTTTRVMKARLESDRFLHLGRGVYLRMHGTITSQGVQGFDQSHEAPNG